MPTYLEQPIYLYGIRVGHTYQGTIDLIGHYTHCMSIATPQQMNNEARQHCALLIENLKEHKALYEKHFEETKTIAK